MSNSVADGTTLWLLPAPTTTDSACGMWRHGANAAYACRSISTTSSRLSFSADGALPGEFSSAAIGVAETRSHGRAQHNSDLGCSKRRKYPHDSAGWRRISFAMWKSALTASVHCRRRPGAPLLGGTARLYDASTQVKSCCVFTPTAILIARSSNFHLTATLLATASRDAKHQDLGPRTRASLVTSFVGFAERVHDIDFSAQRRVPY